MKLSNKTYDILKWVALVALPALQVFWLTVGKVWGFPYLTEVGATIGATGLFIAALLGLSNREYNAQYVDTQDNYNAESIEEMMGAEDEDENDTTEE